MKGGIKGGPTTDRNTKGPTKDRNTNIQKTRGPNTIGQKTKGQSMEGRSTKTPNTGIYPRIFNQLGQTDRRQRLRNNSTRAEQILWQRIRFKQLGVKFRRQFGIDLCTVDFYCPSRKIVIEVDGDSHLEPRNKLSDKKRDSYLSSLGLTVLRFTNAEVMWNVDGVVEVIFRLLVSENADPLCLPLD